MNITIDCDGGGGGGCGCGDWSGGGDNGGGGTYDPNWWWWYGTGYPWYSGGGGGDYDPNWYWWWTGGGGGSGGIFDQAYYDFLWFNSFPEFEINISSQDLGPCGNEIVQKILNQSNSVTKVIKELFSESTKYNLKFELDPNIPGAARAVPSPQYEIRENSYGKFSKLDVTIKINPIALNGSTKLAIAESIIHELIHAYFFYRQSDAFGDTQKEQQLADDLGFLKPFDPNANPAIYGANSQHEQMATSYINRIVEALKEFHLISDEDLNNLRSVYPNLTIEDYYTAMAWGGLTEKSINGTTVPETKAWETFKLNNPQKAAMYLFIISSEDFGTPDAPSKIKC